MTLSKLGKNIFIGDSAATSHMTSNKIGVYNLTPIKWSVIPQQDSVAERKIPTLMGRARGMMIQAGLNQEDKENFGVKLSLQQQN